MRQIINLVVIVSVGGVNGLFRFDSYIELFKEISPKRAGWNKDTPISEAAENMRQYYSKEDESMYGVLGILIGKE